MHRYRKHLALLLVFAIALTTLVTGCESDQSGDGNFLTKLFGFFKGSPPFTDQAKMPDRPYVPVLGDSPIESAKEFLSQEKVGAEELLLNLPVETEILSSDTLDEVADTRIKTDQLRKIRDELEVLSQRMEFDDTADPDLKDKIDLLSEKIDFLFSEGVLEISDIKPKTALMGTWDEPDRVILRWNPQMEWIPDDGYHLYRVLNGVTTLLADNLGTEESIQALTLTDREYAEFIKPLYDNSRAGPDLLEKVGVETSDEFNRLIATRALPILNRHRFSGAEDFSLIRDRIFSVHSTLTGRIPDADPGSAHSTRIPSDIKALPLSVSYIKTYGFSKIVRSVSSSDEEEGETGNDLVMQVFQSRNDFLTKSNTDMEFAQASGFGYEDDLIGEGVEKDTLIEYILVPQKPEWKMYNRTFLSSGQRPEGTVSIKIPAGVKAPLDAPLGLEGYGADGQVHLRWTSPADSYAKSIISGYYIERKMKGESQFSVLNDVPVAISYMDDENGILYEMPVFFTDRMISNHDQAKYRIRALDIFGRLSDDSEEVDITVHKITPPNTPNLDQPFLSNGDLSKADDYVRDSAALNEGKIGVILSIAKTSDDTDEFAVFRSEALGNLPFGNPLEIARINVESDGQKELQKSVVSYRKVKLILHPLSETGVHTVFFDQDIQEGYFYKYWVAAVDETGNESAWSSGKIIGYQTDQLPIPPSGAQIEFKTNTLPELVLDIPGFGKERIVTEENNESTARTEFALQAMEKNISVGISLSKIVRKDVTLLPQLISKDYSNLPEPEDIHEMIALENESLLPDGNARISWYHYSGAGLLGYHVYRAYADGKSLEELKELTKLELMTAFSWTIVSENLQKNTLTDLVEKKDGRIYLYLVFLVPEETENSIEPENIAHVFEPGGWINLSWEKPDDPQWGYYRIYRNEVEYLTEDQNPDEFDWTLVGDHILYTAYSEKADQTHAHYYYYKITSVSIWGVESGQGEIIRYRVASTSPPQTPSMLLPFAQKGKVKISWVGVPFASKYTLFRTKLPKIEEEDIADLELISPDLFTKVFTPVTLNDSFLSNRLFTGIEGDSKLKPVIKPDASITRETTLPLISKFNTVQLQNKTTTISKISQIQTVEKLDIYKNIVSKYGVLAISPYGQLDLDMAKLILWETVTQVEIPIGTPSEGVFDYVDEDVVFGDTYLYTVQAENDDLLTSGRPDPVSVSPRKSAPFPPVTGLKGSVSEIAGNKPTITWESAKDPNLTWKESREHIAGYIVYKSRTQNGVYYQASELLTELEFTDRNADVYAQNWYKVKVVDTGGYLSDFSEPVKVQKTPNFLIPVTKIKPIPLIPKLEEASDAVNLSLSFPVISIAPIAPIVPIQPIIPDTLTVNGFTITNLSKETVTGGKGDGTLRIGESYEVLVTVDIVKRQGTVITQGKATLKDPASFGDTGVYFSELVIDTSKTGAQTTGYVKKEDNTNLLGDLFALTFNQAEMTTSGVIKVTSVPSFHYDHLTLKGIGMATINLGGITQAIPSGSTHGLFLIPNIVYGSSFISVFGGKAENNLGMETLDNKGLLMEFGMMGFDAQGKLTGVMELKTVQTIRTVIPAGLGIRVIKAVLQYKDGAISESDSRIEGKVLLPFETFQDTLPVELDPDLLIRTFSEEDRIVTDNDLHKKIIETPAAGMAINKDQKEIVDRGMYYLASRIQANSLKVLPMDLSVQEKLSTVPFSVAAWNGKGFIVPETTMTPALVGNSEEEIGVTPGKVGLDLSRTQSYTGQAPDEAKEDDWMGIVIKNGRVGLPPAYIKTDEDGRVLFNLTPGEMIYDRNGIFYQNQAYSAEGIPVNFGDSLGGFRDVIVNLIYLDMYNNKVSLEIQGEMGIPLFGYQRVQVRLYTSKELGKLVCSVAQTEKFDPAGTGNIFIKVLGGHLQPDGLHMDGTLDVVFEDQIVSSDMQFTELIIPADMDAMTKESNTDLIYGRALFDRSYRIRFHDFEMDTRILTFDSVKQSFQLTALRPVLVSGFNRDMKLQGIPVTQTAPITFYNTAMVLWGGMQLSDNLAMDNSEDFDRIAISGVFTSPAILYEESKSKLDLNFEGFTTVNAVVTPMVSTDDGLIEYNTDMLNLAFNSSNSLLAALPVQANIRLGYDKEFERYFFAIAIYYHDPSGGIQFGYGTINDITGVIGYNLDLVYDSETGYQFPNSKDGFFHSIDDLAVNRTPAGNYFFAATAWMYLGMETSSGKLKLGEVRNIYLVVEKGPTIEMGGEFYGPATIQSISTGKNFKHMGTARIGYYHNERLFKFSISLYELGMYGCTVSGDLGFALCPNYWEVRIGYPEMLTAKMGLMTGGFGFALRDSDYPHDSFIAAKIHFEYDTGDVTIWPVYFRAYLFAGGEGEYHFDSGNLILHVYIEGGLEGGIKVAGKKYRIIHLMVGANGTLTRYTGDWNLKAQVKIRYHLDLFLTTVSGSVNWHVSKDF
jgi:hypothetical protein